MDDSREVDDSDWALLRAAVPSFDEQWRSLTTETSYEPTLPYLTIGEFARHVVAEVVRHRPDECQELAETLEAEFTRAAIDDDERYEALLRVGFLEGLIEHADECGMPLTWLVPLLRTPRVHRQWELAVQWQRPDTSWDDDHGDVTDRPRPRPVGTVHVRRGRRVDDQTYQLDVHLIGGTIAAGNTLRHRISKNFDRHWPIVAVRRRSVDLPDELEIDIEDERGEEFDMWEYYLDSWDETYWHITSEN